MKKLLKILEVENVGATKGTSQTEYLIKATYNSVTSLFSFFDSGNNAEYNSSMERDLETIFSDNDLDEILVILDTYQGDIVEDKLFQYDTELDDASILDKAYYAYCPVLMDRLDLNSLIESHCKKGYVLLIDKGYGYETYSTRLIPYKSDNANDYGFDLLLYTSDHKLLSTGTFN